MIHRYAIEELERAYPPVMQRADRQKIEFGDYKLLTSSDLVPPAPLSIRVMIDQPQGDDRSKDAYWCALDMLRAGYSFEQIVGVLMNPANEVSGHILDAERPLRAATRTVEAAQFKLAENGQGDGAGRGAGSNAGAAGEATRRPALPLRDPADWEGVEVPPRDYVIHGLVLAGSVTTLTGPGAVGKSLLMQQAATAVALGARFLDRATVRMKSALWTAEDDDRELHQRQVEICAEAKAKLPDLRGQMLVGSLIGLADKALATVGPREKLSPTALFDVLRATIVEQGLKFVVLDNAGHFFGGDENNRSQVVVFIGLLNLLALETGCAIVLISHPNKSGATYSGVTAWQNQVRAQLHLSKPDGEHDSNVRELRLEKANYAPPGEPIRMLWHHGAFVLESAVPSDDPSRTTAVQLRQNEIFYACLAAEMAAQRPVSDAKTAINYAPKIFARSALAQGMNVDDFERTMERLFSAGMIQRGELGFKSGKTRNKAHGIRLAEQHGGTDEPAM